MCAVPVDQIVAPARQSERPRIGAMEVTRPDYFFKLRGPGTEICPAKRTLETTKKKMSVKHAAAQAMLCVWNCVFGGIALIMGILATIGFGIQIAGITVQSAATAVGMAVCEMQMDGDNPEEGE